MPEPNAVGAVATFFTTLLGYFSADERKKRRRLDVSARVAKAISLGEVHFSQLKDFLHFIEPHVPEDKLKEYNRFKSDFERDGRKFKKLT